MEPHLFRTLILDRLRLPLPLTEANCECGSRYSGDTAQRVQGQDDFESVLRVQSVRWQECTSKQAQR